MMKKILFINTCGILREDDTLNKLFDIQNFPMFNNFDTYENYYILYNNTEIANKARIPFTDTKYTGDICVIKHKNNNIINFTSEKFIKLINKKDNILAEYHSSSDSDPLDESCNLDKNC